MRLRSIIFAHSSAFLLLLPRRGIVYYPASFNCLLRSSTSLSRSGKNVFATGAKNQNICLDLGSLRLRQTHNTTKTAFTVLLMESALLKLNPMHQKVNIFFIDCGRFFSSKWEHPAAVKTRPIYPL